MRTDPWTDWQREVVALIRLDLGEVLQDVREEDVDWDAWRPFYEQGHSPQAAVARAFVRDL
ncbi:MAG: hypothetical protein DIU71_11565 [Proteobacteria bacterium]|nr:MAG: hypothetical protein DIU71_11565 [Pseudomonadota bacterium]